jgi:hypothetical protein
MKVPFLTRFGILPVAAAALFLLTSTHGMANVAVQELRCEYARNPVGIDSPAPRLFWQLTSETRGQRQTAYQVLVASSAGLLARHQGDLWDSGKVPSDTSTHVLYAGKPLRSSQTVLWKVRVWDKSGRVSPWSAPATWTMGVLQAQDWQAQWIAAADKTSPRDPQSLLLRSEFKVKPGLRRAIAHVCGLGCYEMSLNGQKVGDALFPPGWTKYDRTCQYDSYEITSLLREGANAVGLLLGNGFYHIPGGRYVKYTGSFGPPKAIAQLHLEYEDGTTQSFGTNPDWRWSPGPIAFSCVYGGEDYDARQEASGWDRPGFDASQWSKVRSLEGPHGTLRGLGVTAPQIKAFDLLEPIQKQELRPGVTVYDLGQNAALMPRLKVRGPAGSVVRITPAELISKDGSIDRGSCGGGAAYWQFTLRGSGEESWFPKFYYHGCRYLQVECLGAGDAGERPAVLSLVGVVVHSASEPVGDFDCSNPLFNRIRTLVRWAQRSNMMTVMTDCPHREKLGWLEEDHLNGPSLRYEFDLARLFSKLMNDMADSQLENGLVPDIAPEYVKFDGGFRDSPEWGSAFVLVPWQQYEFNGDLELLRRHYPAMKRYVAYLASRAKGHIVSHGLGDWYDIGPNPPGVAQLTPIALTATAFYYYDTWILSRAAQLLGFADEARLFSEQAQLIRGAFNDAFFDPKTGYYASGSQCANAIPLVMELVAPGNRETVLNQVVKDVRQRGNALTAGDVGYRYLLRALAAGGRSEVIFDMNNQSEKPGYGYQLKQGATSLTEAWDAGRSSSQNHFMLGQITEWFYHDLAGIRSDPAGPGFKQIIIQPSILGGLTWVSASHRSLYGRIESRWVRQGNRLTQWVRLPPNTAGTVYIRASSPDTVTEKGLPLGRVKGVQVAGCENGYVICHVESGTYEFRSEF